MCYINIISIKDVIIMGKIREKKKLSENITDTIISAKIAWALSFVDFTEKYK